MTSVFIQSHRESWDWCSHSVVKLYEVTQMFVMVDYVREMTVKKCCKYGKYGLFEHLLFLIFVFFFLFFSFFFLCLFHHLSGEDFSLGMCCRIRNTFPSAVYSKLMML